MFKTRLDTFGNDFGHFWNFENFLIFLKIFEDSTLHGTLVQKKFWALFFENFRQNTKTCSKPFGNENMFKTRLPQKTFGNDFGHFWIFLQKFFLIFLIFSKTRPSMEHWAKIFFFEKNTRKHVQNTFGHFWERFWAFLDF